SPRLRAFDRGTGCSPTVRVRGKSRGSGRRGAVRIADVVGYDAAVVRPDAPGSSTRRAGSPRGRGAHGGGTRAPRDGRPPQRHVPRRLPHQPREWWTTEVVH